jgi:hypothetical protein
VGGKRFEENVFIYLWLIYNCCQQLRLHSVEKWGDQLIMNGKECGRKRSLPNLRHHLLICLKRLMKTLKNLSQGSQSEHQDLKPGPAEYEEGVLPTQL